MQLIYLANNKDIFFSQSVTTANDGPIPDLFRCRSHYYSLFTLLTHEASKSWKPSLFEREMSKADFRVFMSVSSCCTLQIRGPESGGYLAVPSLKCRKLEVSFVDILGCMWSQAVISFDSCYSFLSCWENNLRLAEIRTNYSKGRILPCTFV